MQFYVSNGTGYHAKPCSVPLEQQQYDHWYGCRCQPEHVGNPFAGLELGFPGQLFAGRKGIFTCVRIFSTRKMTEMKFHVPAFPVEKQGPQKLSGKLHVPLSAVI